jgi:hypothetical protein
MTRKLLEIAAPEVDQRSVDIYAALGEVAQ